MSNERHETVTDNVSANHQFRETAKMIPHEEVDVPKMETTTLTREKSSAVVNASAMREALEKTQSVIATCMEILNKIPDGCDYDGLVDEVADELCDLLESHVNAALSVPPRNCDLLSDPQEALEAIHEDRCYVNNPIDERRLTVEWLFAESKGATDGSK